MKQNRPMVDLAKPQINGRRRKPKKKWKTPSFSMCLLVITIVIAAYYAINYYHLSEMQRSLQQEIQTLQETNEQLEAEKKKLQSPEEIENVARNQLGMVKSGEVPYVK